MALHGITQPNMVQHSAACSGITAVIQDAVCYCCSVYYYKNAKPSNLSPSTVHPTCTRP